MAELELGITLVAIGTFAPAGTAIDAVRDLKHRVEDSKARRKVERNLVKLERMISGRTSAGKGRKRKRGRGADRDVGRTLRIDD